MVAFIDDHREEYGVEPICQVLPIAPSTYDHHQSREADPTLRPTQYLAIRYTEWLGEAGIKPSVGSRGDSYDNALAESVIGLFKTEVIRQRGPWRGLEDVEFATLE